MRMSLIGAKTKKGRAKLFLLSAIALVFLFLWVDMKTRPVIIRVARGYGENIVANSLNEMIKEELSSKEYDFIDVSLLGDESVGSVSLKSNDTNLFMSEIVLVLKEKILEMEEIEAKIPLGNFLSNPFFSGLGPRISVKFLILANTNVTMEESFQEKGINQTLYTVRLRVDTKVGIYIPGIQDSMTVTNIIPLASELVVGKVPDSYTNVEGMEGSVQDTVLDIE